MLCDKWLTWNNHTIAVKPYNEQQASETNSHVLDCKQQFYSSKSTDADVEMMETDKNVDYVSGGKVKPRSVCDTDTKQC